MRDLINELNKAIAGKEEKIELVVATLVGSGHVLIEDPPGLGKTMLARSLARATSLTFSRIQLTPDVLPSDITGSFVYRAKKEEFEFIPGPIFANIVLVDELNRTTPRTQSALLEAMEERQVTVDGQTFKLPDPFFVIATQNPHEHHGTFPLPESQLDRFSVSLSLNYPDSETEKRIIIENIDEKPYERVSPVVTAEDILRAQQEVRRIRIENSIIDYIVRIVSETRKSDQIALGASPRASIALAQIARALAYLNGREYVIPDDVKYAAPFVLKHRIATLGITSTLEEKESLIKEILNRVPVPVEL